MIQAVRKLVLGTVSVLTLSVGGFILDYPADAGNTVNPVPSVSCIGDSLQVNTNSSEDAGWVEQQLRKDAIRWAQVELRTRGLYTGSLDGVFRV